MTSSRHRAARASEHPVDDLKRISGIGPAAARRLERAGIRSYADLATSTPEELGAKLAGVAGHSTGRIAAEDWIGQARRLAGELPAAQQSASFDVEFLVAVSDAVRCTKVRDNQTGADASWPGWDFDRLVAFLRARVPVADAEASASAIPSEQDEPEARRRELAAEAPPATASLDAAKAESASPALIRISNLTSGRSRASARAATPEEPTAVGLELIPDPVAARAPTLDYSAAITARRLDRVGEFSIADVRGVVRVDQGVSHAAAGPSLPPGLYRLMATVRAYASGHGSSDPPVWSQAVAGDLLQVAMPPSDAKARNGERRAQHGARERLLAAGAITESEFAALQATGPPTNV